MALIPATINVINSLTDEPIPDVILSVWTNVLTSAVVPHVVTNIEGIATVALPQNATYKIFVYKEKVNFQQPLIVTIGTSPIEVTMYGNTKYLNQTITDKVLLYGNLKYLDLSPIQNAKVFIRLSPIPQVEDKLLISKNDLVIITDQNGFFSTLLPGDFQVSVSIPEAHFQITRKLPPFGEIEISQLFRLPE